MAVSLDEVNVLILRYLKESGFDHTAYVFENESFLSSSNVNTSNIPPNALISVLQKSLGYMQVQKSIQRARKDPNDPIHQEITDIEKRFPQTEINPSVDITDTQLIATASIQHPYRQQAEIQEPITLSPKDATILAGHPSDVYSCCWSADGSHLVTAGAEGVSIIWTIENGKPVSEKKIDIKFSSDSADRDFSDVSISCENIIALGSFDRCAYLCDMNGNMLHRLEGHTLPIYGVYWSPNGEKLITISHDKSVIVWSSKGELIQKFEVHTDAILTGAWKNDNVFATGSLDKNIVVYDLSLGSTEILKGHTSKVNKIAWSVNGNLASGSYDNTIRIWREDGTCSHVLQGHTQLISDLKWKPNSDRILASSSIDHTTILWDAQTGAKLNSAENHKGEIITIDFSPSGAYLASGGLDALIVVQNVADSQHFVTFRGTSDINEIEWSPNSENVAVCFADSIVAIIHMKTCSNLLQPTIPN